MCSVSFGILTDSIIILLSVMSMHMQAREVYAKCYCSHTYIIQLTYSSLIEWGLQINIYIYIYIYIKIANNLVMKNSSVFLFEEK